MPMVTQMGSHRAGTKNHRDSHPLLLPGLKNPPENCLMTLLTASAAPIRLTSTLHCQVLSLYVQSSCLSGALCSLNQLPPGLHVNIQAQATQCWISLYLKPFAHDAFPSPFSFPINCLEAILISSLYTHI